MCKYMNNNSMTTKKKQQQKNKQKNPVSDTSTAVLVTVWMLPISATEC